MTHKRMALKIRDTLPFVKEKFVIYVLHVDTTYLDLSDDSKGPLILDEFSDGKFTRDSANLDLQGMRFNSKKLVRLAVLGRTPAGASLNASGTMCPLPWYGLSLDYTHALRCELRLAETFVIIVESRVDFNLKSLTVSRGGGDRSVNTPQRFSHSLLVLLYDETDLDQAHVICMDSNKTANNVHVDTLSCTEIAPMGPTQCLEGVYEDYVRSLSIPGPCGLIRWPDEFRIGSPFHSSSYAPINDLECRGESPTDVAISLSLTNLEGKYPRYTDMIVQSRSEPMYVITCDESLLVLGNAKDPYVTPFDPQVWALLVTTLLVTSLLMATTTQHHPQSTVQFWKTVACALLGTVGVLLQQVTQYMSGGKSLARRIALLSLLLPSILLTNHYRSSSSQIYRDWV